MKVRCGCMMVNYQGGMPLGSHTRCNLVNLGWKMDGNQIAKVPPVAAFSVHRCGHGHSSRNPRISHLFGIFLLQPPDVSGEQEKRVA